MLRIYLTLESQYALDSYLANHLWAGARDRWQNASWSQRQQVIDRIFDYFEDVEDVEINDFIWFECDDIFYPDEVVDFTDLEIGVVD